VELSPTQIVETLQDRFSRLEIDFCRAFWDSQIEASESNDRRREETELAVTEAKGDPEALQAVREALEEEIHDDVLKRQLEVLNLSLTANQMDPDVRERIVTLSSAVESDFASFRPEVDGKRVSDNELEEVLRTSDDSSERRAAWEASKEIGAKTADRIRELARLRNKAAREAGYADYYQMSLQLEELTEDWLFGILDEVESLSNEPFVTFKSSLDERLRNRFGIRDLMPWHYADPFFQSLPPDGNITLDNELAGMDAAELARRTFAAWDIDVSDVIAGSDLYPRERKCQHAFCLDVDRSGSDVRILANVIEGERWVETMLHESGHAAYDIKIDPRLPYLLRRAAHTFVTEAIAIVCGRLTHDPEWLKRFAGVSPDRAEHITGRLTAAQNARSLLFARWVLVMAHFERAMYADPEADLDSLWWRYVSRYQLIEPPPGRSAPDWASKIHVAVAPVYYHNYLLGEILASQLRVTCEEEAGGFSGVVEAGRLLEERIFKAGNLRRWDEVVHEATGRSLSASDFVGSITT
jgi:peptidyl-dipeptidase A